MRSLFLLSAALFTAACGADNVAACEKWVADVSCGDFDAGEFVDCAIYENLNCDISGYFDCLTTEGTCDEATGTYDSTGWGDCATLAVCV